MYPPPVKKAVNPYSLIMFNFISKKILDYNIYSLGCPGEWGYGIASAPDRVLPEGYEKITGCEDLTSDTYGNYLHSESESIMCWIPRFYYRCEGPIIDIVDSYVYSSREIAKNNGYAMHRAFVDGGVEQDGFFIDKYICGIKNNIPISLKGCRYLYNYNTSGGDNFLDNGLNDFYSFLFQFLIKERDVKCSGMSAFNWGALSMIMLTHAHASTSTENNAWYTEDPLKNHVKGVNIARSDIPDNSQSIKTLIEDNKDNNNNYLDPGSAVTELIEGIVNSTSVSTRSNYNDVTDINDTELIYNYWPNVYDGTSHDCNFPSRTSHNGQMSGVMGLRTNGILCFYGNYQQHGSLVSNIGYYNPSKKIMFLKESYKMCDLISNNITNSDPITSSDCTNLYPCAGKYDEIYDIIDTSFYYQEKGLKGFYGNGKNNVFSNDTEGDNWILTGCSIPTLNGMSVTSNEIGQKYYTNSSIDIMYEANSYLAVSTISSREGAYNVIRSSIRAANNIYKTIRYPD